MTDEQAADHLRNAPGLEAALVRPQNHARYEGADLAHQAAVLVHGIAEGQVFVDGNKRTATASLLHFLRLNGFDLTCSKQDLADWIIALSGDETAEDLAARIRGALIARLL